MKFGFIDDHRQEWPVCTLCDVLGVSPAGYYAWRSRPESARAVANRRLLEDVRRLHAQNQGRYGSPRMHVALRTEGRGVSRGRVERLMRRHGIRATASCRFRPATTDSRHGLPIAPTSWSSVSWPQVRTRSGWPISPTSRRVRVGSIWPECSTLRPVRSSAGRCATTCALSFQQLPS